MTEFERRLGAYHNMVQGALPGFLPDPENTPRSLLEAAAYGLLGSGKRVRAILTLAFFEYCGGGDPLKAIPFACAVEMIHAYSLMHDDLPCMDDDDMRRGKASSHIVFGEANALLAGDALLTLAFETMAAEQNLRDFGADKVLAAISSLAHAAGAQGMVGGQVMDLENEGAEISADELAAADAKKTGALIRASAQIGCILAGGTPEQYAAATQYAEKLGLAFQVVDDILDCTADEAALGKPVGSDDGNEKTTYVTAYGLECAKEIAGELTGQAVAVMERPCGNGEFLTGLVKFLCDRNY